MIVGWLDDPEWTPQLEGLNSIDFPLVVGDNNDRWTAGPDTRFILTGSVSIFWEQTITMESISFT